ncbi:hypothetical protein HFO91_22465 [Rhizobium leguminosarum]|uniref:hypothetical protein n=1 Tax=Rhizobium leguminosarum TaxID=384 RepID=UPI001C95E210|nr:hypothetical protein [Rhizobium leguminosarum]MBY5452381.1 hypothetical protein [Rhizobium leguminosarum]
MTITIAWERKLPGGSELVFCSDSRLSGGGNIDVCQKVFPLPREDAAVGFCGSTLLAYPVIHQFISYVRQYKKNMDRAIDGSELPRRFAALINRFLQAYINPVDLKSELMETSFIVGAHSWILKRPVISRIRYENSTKRFVAASTRFPRKQSATLYKAGDFAVIGDLRPQFYQRLAKLIDYENASKFDMQPFSALTSMLGDIAFTDRHGEFKGPIGGAPQLMKIYPFFRTLEFGVYWPNRATGVLHLNGRTLFDYEKLTLPQIDGTTLETFYPMAELNNADTWPPVAVLKP